MKQQRPVELFSQVKSQENEDLKLPNSAKVVTNTLGKDSTSGNDVVITSETTEQKLEEPYLLVFLPGPTNGKFDAPKGWADVDTAAGCTGEAKALFESKILNDNKIKVYFVVPFEPDLIKKTQLPGNFITDPNLEFTAKFKNQGIEIFEHADKKYPRRAALFVGLNKIMETFILPKEPKLCGELSKQAALGMVKNIEAHVQKYALQMAQPTTKPDKTENLETTLKL